MPSRNLTSSHSDRRIVVLACTRTGVSRVARPLRTRGCSVAACGDQDAALDLLRSGGIDLLVVEWDDSERDALGFLQRVREVGFAVPSVLVTNQDGQTLLAAVNDARVTHIVSAEQDIGTVMNDILAVPREPVANPRELQSLRARCTMLEDKIDRLVREGIQRDGASRLVHGVLEEIGSASGVKEVAGKCLARVVTMLRLDMAFVALAPEESRDANDGGAFFSFGCPRSMLDPLRDLPWAELVATHCDAEKPRSLLEILPDVAATSLARTMQREGVKGLMLLPLRAQGTAVGFLGLGDRQRRVSPTYAQLAPVAKQIAIAIESSRLFDAAAGAEALASGVLSQGSSTVVVCDPAGRVIRCFDDQQRLFEGRAIPGANLIDLMSVEDARPILRQIADVARGADPVWLRALRLGLASGDRLLNASIAALAGSGVMLILEDVTHRESMAGDLRRARALTSSLFANASTGSLFLRNTGEVIDINSTGCTIFRSTRKEMLGKSLNDLFPELWRAVTLDADAGRGEVTFNVCGDEQATVSFSSSRLGRRGRPAGILLQVQDLKELQALREELRRKDNLALMGQMVSFIAHEIKNPLFGISSAAQVLAREAGDDESNQLSSAMLSEIDRLAELLEELLVFGSKRVIEPIEADPTELVREIATMQRQPMSQRGIALELDLVAPEDGMQFDPARMRQVMVNLVANAVEATPEGGTVSITARQVDREYVIEVHNTGEPIPEEAQQRIFDLFYSTKPRGSGLGLPICKKIVEEHGGRLEVCSTADEGTTFVVGVPVVLC